MPEGIARGVVGVGRSLEIEVLIEKRPYYVIRRERELPLAAVVEIDVQHADDELHGLPASTIERLVDEVCRAAPALLVQIAKAAPHLFGDPTPARGLLAAWVANAAIATGTRQVLCTAEAFPTVQGGRTSIFAATAARTQLRVAHWHGDWLGAGDGDRPTVFDEPVVQLADGSPELDTIFARLYRGSVTDVSDEITHLQANRRIARGLVPTPRVRAAPRAMTRSLADLGGVAAALGHGEVGLLDTASPHLAVHVAGEWRRAVPLDVLPPIELAIEASEHLDFLADGTPHPISALAQDIAVLLVRAVAAADPDLPPMVRAACGAVLARRIAAADVAGTPVFPTLARTWVDAATVEQQIRELGDCWAVVIRPDNPTPLDPRRIVLDVVAGELAQARASNLAIVDATAESSRSTRSARGKPSRACPRRRSARCSPAARSPRSSSPATA